MKLDHVLSYLLFSRPNKMILRIGQHSSLNIFVDASFGLYEDGKSVTGVAIMLGDATIYVKSGKQTIVTRSYTESELVGVSDDNQSTIFLANKGRSKSERSRHIKIRYFFVQHYIEESEIKLQYLPTGQMVVDILTKPLHGAFFKNFTDKLTGNSTTNTTTLSATQNSNLLKLPDGDSL